MTSVKHSSVFYEFCMLVRLQNSRNVLFARMTIRNTKVHIKTSWCLYSASRNTPLAITHMSEESAPNGILNVKSNRCGGRWRCSWSAPPQAAALIIKIATYKTVCMHPKYTCTTRTCCHDDTTTLRVGDVSTEVYVA